MSLLIARHLYRILIYTEFCSRGKKPTPQPQERPDSDEEKQRRELQSLETEVVLSSADPFEKSSPIHRRAARTCFFALLV
jgi:hypothetical protein